MNVNEILKNALKSSKKTQVQLSEAIGVPKSTVNNWLKLGRDIPAQYIIPICGFLGCSADFLLTGEETKTDTLSMLSEDEAELLGYFRDMEDKERQRLIGLAMAYAEKRPADDVQKAG